MSGLSGIDIVILGIFLYSIVMGFIRGFVGEIVSLATLVVAVIVALTFTQPLAHYFTSLSSVQGVVASTTSTIGVNTVSPVSYMAYAVSFFLIFAGTLLAGAIVKSVLNLVFQSSFLGLGNSLLGAIFGFARGFIYNLIIIFIIQLTPMSSQSWFQRSQFVYAFQPAIAWMGSIISPTLGNLKSRLGQAVDEVSANVGSSVQGMTNSL